MCAGVPTAPEYSIVFAEHVRQIDSETIKFSSIQWLPLAQPYPDADSYGVFVRYYNGLCGRLLEHCETDACPPATGDECPATETAFYGDVGCGSLW